MLLHFYVGIAVRNAEEMHKIYDSIMAQYPGAKGTKSRYVNANHIDLPLIRIQFFYLSSHCMADRYDIIYAPDDITDEEKYEILYPMIPTTIMGHLRPYSELYEKSES